MVTNVLKDTNIAVKVGFTSMLLLVLIFGVISLYQLHNITLNMTNTVGINSKKMIHVTIMRDQIRKRQIIMSSMLSMEDDFEREENRIIFYKISGVYREERSKLVKLPISETENKLLTKITGQILIAQPLNRDAVESLMGDYTSQEARTLISRAQGAQRTLLGLLDKLVNLQNENTQQFINSSRKNYKNILYWSIVFGSIISLLAWLISRIMTRFVSQKNDELVAKNKQLEVVSKQALEATRTKSDFLATMSHEIRTPLTAIIGFAEALSERTTKLPDRIGLTKIIIKNGKHLLKIINDILDISKVEANKMEFEEIDFSPIEVIYDVEQVMKPQFKEKNVQFYIEFEYPLPEFINNDPLRTKQIILNLCSNALKFTESGKVTIKIHSDIESEKIFFNVIDSGIGMTSDQVDKVFNAFTQADSSTTRKYGGTGLGLSLSKQYAEKMGGTITIESLKDIGSQFCFNMSTGNIDHEKLILNNNQLPKRAVNTEEHHLDLQIVKGNILVAEDNEDNQQLLSIFLGHICANVTFANNGQIAIESAMENNYDLILMDMQMPVMGGLEATQKLREAGYKKPIVALTANAMKSDYDACIAAGCDDFLTKPIYREKLYQTVYNYLETEENNINENEKIVSNNFNQQSIRFKELIIKFVNELPLTISKIEKSYIENDCAEITKILHQLKGIGTSMGYPMITDISAEMEYETICENEQEFSSLFSKFKNICERIEKGTPDLTYDKLSEIS